MPPTDVERISPVEASSRYLAHIRDAWNEQIHEREPLEQQDIVLTVPASFDEVARELTVEAARTSGAAACRPDRRAAGGVLCLDLQAPGRLASELVAPGQKILVCDIGGGTTDFTLIRVRATTTAKSSSIASPSAIT